MKQNIPRRLITLLPLLSALLFCVVLLGCDQEPLFFDIATEYPPIKPVIKGHPTQIVATTSSPSPWEGKLYVTNGDIWVYNAAPGQCYWARMYNPSGTVRELAVAGNMLFALDSDGKIYRFNDPIWESITVAVGAGKPERIFGAGTILFAGSRTGAVGKDGYCVLAMNAAGTAMNKIIENTSLLMGAAYDGSVNYYLGTNGKGIYSPTNSTTVLDPDTDVIHEASIIGLVAHKTIIVGVTAEGHIVYESTPGTFTTVSGYSHQFTGALASWTQDGTNYLLLVGLQRSSNPFGYGYRELVWKSGDNFNTNLQLYTPGENPISSVTTDLQYISAIGKHPINHLFVMPYDADPAIPRADADGRPIIFASTVKNGLWSYRTRSDKAQWNGESN